MYAKLLLRTIHLSSSGLVTITCTWSSIILCQAGLVNNPCLPWSLIASVPFWRASTTQYSLMAKQEQVRRTLSLATVPKTLAASIAAWSNRSCRTKQVEVSYRELLRWYLPKWGNGRNRIHESSYRFSRSTMKRYEIEKKIDLRSVQPISTCSGDPIVQGRWGFHPWTGYCGGYWPRRSLFISCRRVEGIRLLIS